MSTNDSGAWGFPRILVLVGGVLVVASVFQPWIDLRIMRWNVLDLLSETTRSQDPTGIALIAIIASGAIAAVSALMRQPTPVETFLGLVCVLALGVGYFHFRSSQMFGGTPFSFDATRLLGSGFWTAAIGGVGVLIGGAAGQSAGSR